MAKTKDIFTEIDELAAELGTAADFRSELEQTIADLDAEKAALDQMMEDATDHDEFIHIKDQLENVALELAFAKKRLQLFDASPRIDLETLTDLTAQLDAEVDAAARRFRQQVEKPVDEIIEAGAEFDAAIERVRKAVVKLEATEGTASRRDKPTRNLLSRFDAHKMNDRAFCDGSVIHSNLHEALRLSRRATLAPFSAI